MFSQGIDAEKPVGKIQQSFLIKTLEKTGMYGYLTLSNIYLSPKASVLINSETVQALTLRSGTILFHIVLVVVTNAIKQKKLITVTRIDKEKTGLSICRRHDGIPGMFQKINDKTNSNYKQVQQGSRIYG